MLTLIWNISAAIHNYTRFYMPTNVAIGLLRSPPARNWTIPVTLVATAAYLFAVSVCATIIATGGPGWLNVLVFLFAWNALKFAALAIVTAFRWAASLLGRWVPIPALAGALRPDAGTSR